MPFVLSMKDIYRQSIEGASGGKNTVMYDDKGAPSIMVCIPRFNLSDVIDGAPNTPHPAFIVDGVVKSEIWVSKYQNVVHDNKAYSQPGLDPAVGMNFDKAKEYCDNKNGNGEEGWHLMTNAEWAAIALWSKKNGTMPRGNNNYGSDHSASYERGKETSKSGDKTARVATGSGYPSWSHDHTNAGIFDLNGNVQEWVDGFKLVDGEIYVHKDNDFKTPGGHRVVDQWVKTGAAYDVVDGKLVINNEITNSMNPDDPSSDDYNDSKHIIFESIEAAPEYTVPDLLKYLAIAPGEGDHGGDRLYVRNYGERFPYRGGSYANTSYAGVFYLYLSSARTNANTSRGFRSARVL
jgi:hypothetical protein